MPAQRGGCTTCREHGDSSRASRREQLGALPDSCRPPRSDSLGSVPLYRLGEPHFGEVEAPNPAQMACLYAAVSAATGVPFETVRTLGGGESGKPGDARNLQNLADELRRIILVDASSASLGWVRFDPEGKARAHTQCAAIRLRLLDGTLPVGHYVALCDTGMESCPAHSTPYCRSMGRLAGGGRKGKGEAYKQPGHAATKAPGGNASTQRSTGEFHDFSGRDAAAGASGGGVSYASAVRSLQGQVTGGTSGSSAGGSPAHQHSGAQAHLPQLQPRRSVETASFLRESTASSENRTIRCIQPAFGPSIASLNGGVLPGANLPLARALILTLKKDSTLEIDFWSSVHPQGRCVLFLLEDLLSEYRSLIGRHTSMHREHIFNWLPRITQFCQNIGAASVIFALPDAHDTIGFTAFTLDDWAKQISSLPAPSAEDASATSIPVLLTLHKIGGALRDAFRDYRPVSFTLDTSKETAKFVDGRKATIPLLSEILREHFRARVLPLHSVSSEALALVKHQRGECHVDLEKACHVLCTELASEDDFPLFLALSKALVDAHRTHSARDGALSEIYGGIVARFVLPYQWNDQSLGTLKGCEANLRGQAVAYLREIAQNPSLAPSQVWAVLSFCVAIGERDPGSQTDQLRRVASSEDLRNIHRAVEDSIRATGVGQGIFPPRFMDALVHQCRERSFVHTIDDLNLLMSVGGLEPQEFSRATLRVCKEIFMDIARTYSRSADFETLVGKCRFSDDDSFTIDFSGLLLKKLNALEMQRWLSSESWNQVKVPTITEVCKACEDSRQLEGSVSHLLHLFVMLRDVDKEAALCSLPGMIRRFVQQGTHPRDINHVFEECKSMLGEESTLGHFCKDRVSECVVQSPPLDILWWFKDSSAYKVLKVPTIKELCESVGQVKATLADHLELFKMIEELDADTAKAYFPAFIRKQVLQCKTPSDLDALWTSCKSTMGGDHGQLKKTFTEAAEEVIATHFAPSNVLGWMKNCRAYKDLCVPSEHQLCQWMESRPSKDFADCIKLYEHLDTCEVESKDALDASCRRFLIQHLSRSTTQCCLDFIRFLQVNVVKNIADTAFLDTEFRKCVKSIPLGQGTWSSQKGRFAKDVCREFNSLKEANLVKDAIRIAAEGLLPNVEMGESVTFDCPASMAQPAVCTFWSHVLMKLCYSEDHNVVATFKDIGTLLGAMERWNISNPKKSLLSECLRLAKSLDLTIQKEATDVRTKFLRPLEQCCQDIFAEESISVWSFEQIGNAKKHKTTLRMIEGALLRDSNRWFARIDGVNRQWREHWNRVQSRRPLLESLQPFIPALIRDLEQVAYFRASETDSQHESLRSMRARVECIKDFLDPLLPHEELWSHFILDASRRASSQSVLFKFFLKRERQQQPHQEWEDVGKFAQSLAEVRKCLARFLKVENPEFTLDELMDVGHELKSKDRPPADELKVLTEFRAFKGVARTVEHDLNVVLELYGLKEPLSNVRKALRRHDFPCAADGANDEHLEKVHSLSKDLANPAITASWSAEEREERLQHIRDVFCPGKDHNSLVGLLRLFECLAAAEKVWQFVHSRQEYVSPEGGGYSSSFNDKVEDFLDQLGGEDRKILENFKPVVHWIATLVFNHGKSFAQLMQALVNCPKIMMQARLPLDTRPFSQIESAESNMDFLANLFEKGLGGLDSVLWQFQSIDRQCFYAFDLKLAELELLYRDEQKQRELRLNHEEVLDLEQRLGFVQHEEKAQEYNIAPYLETLQEYRRVLGVMCELYSLGHRNWDKRFCILPVEKEESDPVSWPNIAREVLQRDGVGRIGKVLQRDEVSTVDEVAKKWQHKLDDEMHKSQLLCLFSSSAAQHMHDLIVRRSVNELAHMLCPLFDPRPNLPNQVLMNLRMKSQSVAATHAEQARQSGREWPEQTALFLKKIVSEMKRAQIHVALSDASSCGGAGPMRYSADASHRSLMRLLLHIFDGSDRPPKPYEVLWCDKATSSRMLEGFIKRSEHYPKIRFVLLQVDLLKPALQHVLLRILLNSRDASAAAPRAGHNLHLIETGPCVMQTATWIIARTVDECGCPEPDTDARIKEMVFDKSLCIARDGVTCFCGPTGCGKTYQMRRRIQVLKDEGYAVAMISITEVFSLGDAIEQLLSALQSATRMTICCQINIGKFKRSEGAQWIALMNLISKFFFGLLMLRCVESPLTASTFNVPPGCELKVLVEIPDRAGHFDETFSGTSNEKIPGWLYEEVPVLAAVANCVRADQESFDVCDEAIHVAKYLKAYDDGSIDQLYGSGSGGPKDVVFVLDRSGSMSGGSLETCKRCLFNDIFAQRLTAEDYVSFIAFDGGIHAHVDLGQWQGSHRASIESTLRNLGAGGGTCLWNAFKLGCRKLMGRHSPGRTRWIVALTDGVTGDDPTECHQILRSGEGGSIHVLFITVNLGGQYADPIRRTCMRSDHDGMFAADGGADALAQAWQQVGERLTVSEQIEKQGADITPGESEELLRKYMKLDGEHGHWSRLKQMHWIRYLYRRCGILAASEKFNRNQDMEGFGSTTMKVMLEEVELALADDYQVDWHGSNHEQLVYCKTLARLDGEDVVDYKWSILATNPDAEDEAWQTRCELLRSLNMTVPTKADLSRGDRRVLDAYLANGLGIALSDKRTEQSTSGDVFDFEIGTLPLIDDKRFVLTLDFVMKMLCMNERIECRVPCIMEGETGVSKTALTRMLFMLKNEAPRRVSELERAVAQARHDASSELAALVNANEDDDERQHRLMLSSLRQLAEVFEIDMLGGDEQRSSSDFDDSDELAAAMCALKPVEIADAILDELRLNPALDPLASLHEDDIALSTDTPEQAETLLKWYVNARASGDKGDGALDWTFHAVDVHAALTPCELERDPVCGIRRVIDRARRLLRMAELLDSARHRAITLCIFFDEVNTSSCMGVFKELLIDHSLGGEPLPPNIVLVAACNPSRERIDMAGDRREELGNEWVIGHYQVHPLPASLEQMKWNFGSLNPSQEREFVEKKLAYIVKEQRERAGDRALSEPEVAILANVVYVSQQRTREFAEEHLRKLVQLRQGDESEDSDATESDLKARASSAVSLRDILRVFQLYAFFANSNDAVEAVLFPDATTSEIKRHRAMLLAIAGATSNKRPHEFLVNVHLLNSQPQPHLAIPRHSRLLLAPRLEHRRRGDGLPKEVQHAAAWYVWTARWRC